MSQGPRIVTSRKAGQPVRNYVYAWRGGPLVHKQEGGSLPKLTGAIIDGIAKARAEKEPAVPDGTIKSLITSYRASPKWACLSPTTRGRWLLWLDCIDERFGKTPLAVFEDQDSLRNADEHPKP